MIGKLCRRYYPTQTEGELSLYDEETLELEFKCKTLELPYKDNERNVSCIPEGHYNVVQRSSPKYGNHLHVLDVPNRSLILFHHANFAGSKNPRTGHSDLRGCIAVGREFRDISGDGILDVVDSKNTMKALMDVAPDGFILEVTQ